MPAEEPETAANAGISPPEEVDVAALFARLKEEVRHAPGHDVSNGFNRGLVRTRLRSVAERWWPVSAERPLERRPGARGAVLYPVKKVLRRLMRFYVEPFAADQRAFNDAALKLVDELFEEVDLAFGRLDRAEHELAQRREDARRVGELEERLTRVERRRADGVAPATVAAQPAAAALPDYFAFEARMRGRSEEIRERQRAYVEDFRDAAPVRLLELAAAKLRPGGLLVAETINPLSPLALRYYFADLTHAQPLVPETLELLARQAGFRETELRYLNPPEGRLREVELEDDASRAVLAANVQRLNEVLFGPLD